MTFLSELAVGSFLIYAQGRSSASAAARQFILYEIKQAREGKIERVARRLRDLMPGSVLEPLLQDPGLLVPVPGHAPRPGKALWVPERICRALVGEGIGQEWEALLERSRAVRRSSASSTAAGREDPPGHYATLRVSTRLAIPERITLVDDVVTRGSTLIACATRLHEQFPNAELQAFAIARVEVRELAEKREMAAPRLEKIRYDEASGRLVRS